MKIGIDLDDVLADFANPWIRFHNNRYNSSIKKDDVHSYSLGETFKVSPEEIMRRIYEFYESPEFEEIVPMRGAPLVIQRLAEHHNLYIVSSRPNHVLPKTEAWSEKHFPDTMQGILHSNQFSPKSEEKILKSKLCKDTGIDLMIEDAIHYAKDIAGVGIATLLLEQPWNINRMTPSGITRVRNWEEIGRKIEELRSYP